MKCEKRQEERESARGQTRFENQEFLWVISAGSIAGIHSTSNDGLEIMLSKVALSFSNSEFRVHGLKGGARREKRENDKWGNK